MSLTRKEHEAALRQERDWFFETALRYWDRPHSLRGNVLRIRMVGGRDNTFFAIVLFGICLPLMLAAAIMSQVIPTPHESDLEQISFRLESVNYVAPWGRFGPRYYLNDEQGTVYRILTYATNQMVLLDLEGACQTGAEVTVGAERMLERADGKTEYICDTLTVNGKAFLTYAQFAELDRNARLSAFVICTPVVTGLIALMIWYLLTIAYMERYPKFCCREYHMKQLPPTWEEVLRREEPGYRKRHPDWEFPTE